MEQPVALQLLCILIIIITSSTGAEELGLEIASFLWLADSGTGTGVSAGMELVLSRDLIRSFRSCRLIMRHLPGKNPFKPFGSLLEHRRLTSLLNHKSGDNIDDGLYY